MKPRQVDDAMMHLHDRVGEGVAIAIWLVVPIVSLGLLASRGVPLVGTLLIAATGGVLGWRLWHRRFIITAHEVLIRNFWKRWTLDRNRVVSVKISERPVLGRMMHLTIEGRGEPIPCGVVVPRFQYSVRSHESFKAKVERVAHELVGADAETPRRPATQPKALPRIVQSALLFLVALAVLRSDLSYRWWAGAFAIGFSVLVWFRGDRGDV
jgi:hypothetical protein